MMARLQQGSVSNWLVFSSLPESVLSRNVFDFLNFLLINQTNLNCLCHVSPQLDDAEGEEEREIVDDQGNEGDADASDTKRKGKQEEEV